MIWGVNTGYVCFDDFDAEVYDITSHTDYINGNGSPVFGVLLDGREHEYEFHSTNLIGLAINQQRYRCTKQHRRMIRQEYR